jgi:phosphate:Na+ symporter
MANIAESMYGDVVNQLHSFNTKTMRRIREKEEVLDILQRDISSFLITLSRQQLSAENLIEIPTMLQLVNDLEHLGDQNEAVMDYLRRKKEDKLRFSNSAMTELKQLATKISEIVALAAYSLDKPDSLKIDQARDILNAILTMQDIFHSNHISRLHAGKCTIMAGLLFGDMLAACVKIAQHAYAIIETEGGLLNVTTNRSN